MQILEYHLNGVGGTWEGYRDGVYIGSAAYTARAVGGNVNVMSSLAGGYLTGKIAELWHRDSLLTGADLYDVRAEMWAEHGFTTTPLMVPGHQAYIDPSDDTSR